MSELPKFALADSVRVKSGVLDPDYPDIPLGGWRGTIAQIWPVTPPLYRIRWDRQTLEGMPPVYRKRCVRDGFVLEEIWLSESDLEADRGEPLAMEQPALPDEPPSDASSPGEAVRRRYAESGPAFAEDELLTLAPGSSGTTTQPPREFPFGTVAFYGPDDRITTKIVASVLLAPDAQPILRSWTVVDFDTDAALQEQMQDFFRSYGVKSLAIGAGNVGCPHEAGKDFPLGGDCPFCPFWRGKQGPGAGL